MRYVAGLQVALELTESAPFKSLIDIGCGDGRFLKEVHKRHNDARLKGVDFSPTAIGYAKAFSPQINFAVEDITKTEIEQRWDVATLIEVCEHIAPEDLTGFLQFVTNSLEEKGRIVITVPHRNKQLSTKHYQHFNSQKLEELLSPNFENIRFVYFDSRSHILKALLLLIGGKGNFLVITLPFLNRFVHLIYKRFFLKTQQESDCLRIACIATKK